MSKRVVGRHSSTSSLRPSLAHIPSHTYPSSFTLHSVHPCQPSSETSRPSSVPRFHWTYRCPVLSVLATHKTSRMPQGRTEVQRRLQTDQQKNTTRSFTLSRFSVANFRRRKIPASFVILQRTRISSFRAGKPRTPDKSVKINSSACTHARSGVSDWCALLQHGLEPNADALGR